MLALLVNTICRPGTYGVGGQAPCTPCDTGAFGASPGLGAENGGTCSGLCPAGLYSTGGAVACSACPAGRFGASPGLTSAACSGVCVGGTGRVCTFVGATSSSGTQCPPGRYLSNGTCVLCPAGQYGALPGLTTPACSGLCSAGAGSYCPEGASSPVGVLCPRGTYTTSLGFTSCQLCPAGTNGTSLGMSVATCTGTCPPGQYSTAGSLACTPCPGPCLCAMCL